MLTWLQTHAIMSIYDGKYANATDVFNFITNNDRLLKEYFGGISPWNFRYYHLEDGSFEKFVEDNRAEFGATIKYLPINHHIKTAFANDMSRSYAVDVSAVLRKAKVLIYSGQNDFVTNAAGVLQYLNSLNWEGIN